MRMLIWIVYSLVDMLLFPQTKAACTKFMPEISKSLKSSSIFFSCWLFKSLVICRNWSHFSWNKSFFFLIPSFPSSCLYSDFGRHSSYLCMVFAFTYSMVFIF
jgi:hypothetical protein